MDERTKSVFKRVPKIHQKGLKRVKIYFITFIKSMRKIWNCLHSLYCICKNSYISFILMQWLSNPWHWFPFEQCHCVFKWHPWSPYKQKHFIFYLVVVQNAAQQQQSPFAAGIFFWKSRYVQGDENWWWYIDRYIFWFGKYFVNSM